MGIDEVGEMPPELAMVVVVIALNSCFLDRPVHAFDLPICPGMLDLGQSMFDFMLAANTIKDVRAGKAMPLMIGELNAIVGEYRVDLVGQHGDEIAQELRGQQAAKRSFVGTCQFSGAARHR